MSFRSTITCFFGTLLAVSASFYPTVSAQANMPQLTEQETAWLEAHPKISVGPDPNFAPIEYFGADGSYMGIAADYLHLLETKLGIQLEVQRLEDWNESLEKAKNGKVDIWTAAMETPQRSEYMLFTTPYLKVPAVIIVRDDSPGENLSLESLNGLRVAVAEGYAAHDFIVNTHPQLHLMTVPDIETGLNKLSFGQIDAFIGNIATAARYAETAGLGNLRVAGNSGFYYQWALASRKDWPELRGILQKGLDSITPEETQEIHERWIRLGPQSSILTTELIFEILTGASLLILIGMLIWMRSLKKLVDLKTEELQQELVARRNIEEELRQQNHLLDEVGSLADVGGWEFDLATSELRWSATTYDIHEVDEDFAPNVEDAISFYAPEARGKIQDAFNQAVANGVDWDLELPMISAKGNPRWVRARGRSELKDGKVVKLFGAFQDISIRKKSERESQRQKNLLEQIGALAIIGGWEIDLRTNEHRWSKTIYKIHEVADDFDPSVEKVIDLYAPEARDTIRATYEQALIDGKGWDIEIALLTVKGNRKWVRSRALCEMVDGKVVRLYGLTQDITRYHEVESQLKQNQKELSNQIFEMEVSRRQVEKQAEELVALAEEQNSLRAKAELGEKSKAEFLAIMSHEIRTPMTGIIGMTDLLLLEDLSKDQKKKAQTIKHSSEILLTILNDILDQSKLDSGKFELSNIDIRLPELIQEAIALMSDKAESKGLSLDYCPAADLPAGINIDSIRLQQILINLMSNAIKFTETGAINLNVRRDTTGDDGKVLRFEVVDQGIGISEDHLTRLFQRFEQADPSTARKYGGSGLGLSICKQLVELMGGDIGVESELGNGSCFWFTVPLREVEVEQFTDAADEMPTEQNLSLHILLAEDNAVNQTLISTMVGAAGHSIEIVDNGQKAMDAVLAGNFDLVLMDVRMPIMEGPEATRRIRASGHKNADIPIIALTADAVKENIPQFLAAGMNAVETKPIQLPKLLKSIEAVVAESGNVAVGEGMAETPAAMLRDVEIGDTAKMIELNNLLDGSAMTDLISDAALSINNNIAQIKDGIASGNGEDVQRLAHTIRGMCASLGAGRLAEEASYIEEHIDDLAQVETFLPHFEATAEQTIEWWNQFTPTKIQKSA